MAGWRSLKPVDEPLFAYAGLPEAEAMQHAADSEAEIEFRLRVGVVEDAVKAIGLSIDSVGGRLLRMIAKVAAFGVLRRTLSEIAHDEEVWCSERHLADEIDQLVEDGLLLHDIEPSNPNAKRSRGRPPKIHRLAVNWDEARRVKRSSDEWEEKMRRECECFVRNELPRNLRGGSEVVARDLGDTTEVVPRSDGDLASCTIYPPNNPLTQIPDPPNLPATSEKTKPTEEREDQNCLLTSREATEPTARRIMAAMRWPQGDAQTVWRVAAAFDAGLLSEHDVGNACRGVMVCQPRNPIAYFRSVLRRSLGMTDDEMVRFLSRVRMRGRYPTEAPERNRPVAFSPLQSPPAETLRINERSTNHAHRNFLKTLSRC